MGNRKRRQIPELMRNQSPQAPTVMCLLLLSDEQSALVDMLNREWLLRVALQHAVPGFFYLPAGDHLAVRLGLA